MLLSSQNNKRSLSWPATASKSSNPGNRSRDIK
jgi:hypothetical protein